MFNIREFRKEPDRLADFLPWAALIAPGVVLNKEGSFQTTYSYRGPDLESSTDSELIVISERMNNALKPKLDNFGYNYDIFASNVLKY